MMVKSMVVLASAVSTFFPVAAVVAQTAPVSNYTSVDAVLGTPVRLGYHASADRTTCKPVRSPTIRVLQAPKEGALTVATGQVTTDKIAGCPPMKIPGQAVLYTANKSDASVDHLSYEVTDAKGAVVVYVITVNIKAKPHVPSPSRPEQKT
jgi:hypothetical protein